MGKDEEKKKFRRIRPLLFVRIFSPGFVELLRIGY
jgi:hypothetical protein